MEAEKKKQSSGPETKVATKGKQEVQKKKKTETAKKMKGSDGDDKERDDEFAESYDFPAKYNLFIMEDAEYEKDEFTRSL
jgi:hypothetical protein